MTAIRNGKDVEKRQAHYKKLIKYTHKTQLLSSEPHFSFLKKTIDNSQFIVYLKNAKVRSLIAFQASAVYVIYWLVDQ